jgi:pyrroline-5-carboxylate reductase
MSPQIVPALRDTLQPGALAISIAAGVPLSVFASYLVDRAIVRAMPNTPAQIGAGMTVWTATPNVTTEQNQWAKTIFQALGQELYVEDEHYLDMATALNGSGPAYIFLILEAMIDSGVQLGFTRPKAQELVYQTMLGSVLYAKQTGLHPAQLRNAVTSPGGTTAAALSELERGNIRTTLNNAIWAAYNHACALGKREEP